MRIARFRRDEGRSLGVRRAWCPPLELRSAPVCLQGGFWSGIEAINDNFEYVGYTIIGFFALSGGVAFAVWAAKRR